MKVKNITIGIKGLEESLGELAEIAKATQQGHPPKHAKVGVYFVDLKAMRSALTPQRLRLLSVIREKHPASVYQLAKMVGRALKNVQDDVSLLSRIGLVSLSRRKTARNKITPRVDYDRLQLQIPVAYHP